jgi:ClpP class serine protease
LALAGDEIYAEEASLLGSIGVVSSGFGFTRLIDRLGIDRRLHTAGENKSLLDPFLPEREAEIERLAVLQQDIHASFKEQVLRRRVGKLSTADETLFSGEVMTGRMALVRGLIDGIGDLRTVMRARFGERVRLVAIASERRRRWFAPRPRRGIEANGLGLVADLVDWLEARLLWARFDL